MYLTLINACKKWSIIGIDLFIVETIKIEDLCVNNNDRRISKREVKVYGFNCCFKGKANALYSDELKIIFPNGPDDPGINSFV
jgi:hypothetical protein